MKHALRIRVPSFSPRLELDVAYAARRPWVPRLLQFERWAAAALADSTSVNVISIRIVGDTASRALNARYRGKAKPTNVLSFQGAGAGPDGKAYLGELVICAPVVAREAKSQGKSAPAHWAHMTIHGVLHLRGFDHEIERQARRMESKETQILDRLGFSNPYL